jgi:biopolymer transport protein ExbB/TolQ
MTMMMLMMMMIMMINVLFSNIFKSYVFLEITKQIQKNVWGIWSITGKFGIINLPDDVEDDTVMMILIIYLPRTMIFYVS